MKRSIVFFLAVLTLLWSVSPAYAEIGETLGIIGEGIVDLPVSLVKVVGGTLKLVGEILILPFSWF